MELWDDISTEKMNALYCKMQRSESRAESSLSSYAERRMLSTKSNAKEHGENPIQRTAGVGLLPAVQQVGDIYLDSEDAPGIDQYLPEEHQDAGVYLPLRGKEEADGADDCAKSQK